MISVITPCILVLVSSIAKAIMDTLQFHFSTSVFKNTGSWFNPSTSWQNKYNWSKNKVITWLISNPLVALTDAWHFFGLIQRACLFGCLLSFFFFPPTHWWFVLILYAEFAIVFHVFFTWIFA